MHIIELSLLDTEKKYDPSIISHFVYLYNEGNSTSLSADDYHHVIDTLDYVLKHGDTIEEGIQNIKKDIHSIIEIYKSIDILPIHNEKYLDVLKNQIPFFIHSITGEDALFHYCDMSVDLDYPLFDGIPLYHDMYHLTGTDLVLYYLKRLKQENDFCALFTDLEAFIAQYEKSIKASIYDMQINFFELVLYQCIGYLSMYGKPGLLIYDHKDINNIEDIVHALSFRNDYIRLFENDIIQSFDVKKLVYPEESHELVLTHTGGNYHQIVKQFNDHRDVKLLKELSIYDLIDFLGEDILSDDECDYFIKYLSPIEITSILKLIIPELDSFHNQCTLEDIQEELDDSITYQRIISQYITDDVLRYYHQLSIKKEGSV